MVTASLKNIIRQFILFCGVGGLNTALSLLIILVLSEFMGLHYILANVIGYAAGLISGFIMHKKITFRSQKSTRSVKNQALIFVIIFMIGYLSQLGLLMILVESIKLPNMPSQIMAWALYVALSFTGNKFFTFDGAKHE